MMRLKMPWLKSGFIKVFWDDSITATTSEYTDLDPISYQALTLDPNVEIVKESVTMETITQVDPLSGEEVTQEIPARYDLTIRRVKAKDQVCIESIPPEEVLISRNARDLESASYVAHRMIKSVSDLVAMGYDKTKLSNMQRKAQVRLTLKPLKRLRQEIHLTT